jgi:hypothetical protein
VLDETEDDEVLDATEEDDGLVDDGATEDEEDEEDDETTWVDETDEVVEATEEEEADEDEDELNEEDEDTALGEAETLDEEGATELEEGARIDGDKETTLARVDERDVGSEMTLEDDDDDEATTAGQLLGLDLMLSATLVRLKYASILRIFNTLSAVGGPCAQLLPFDLRGKGTIRIFSRAEDGTVSQSHTYQLFQIQDPGVVGTLSVIVCTRTPSMKNFETPGSQSSLYSCHAVLASAGAATL